MYCLVISGRQALSFRSDASGPAGLASDLLKLGSECQHAALLGSRNHASVLLREQHGCIKHDLHNNVWTPKPGVETMWLDHEWVWIAAGSQIPDQAKHVQCRHETQAFTPRTTSSSGGQARAQLGRCDAG